MHKIKTIANCQVRDIERKVTSVLQQQNKELFIILNKILSHEKAGKNKIYSMHEPEVGCIVKGKEAKKFEIGNEPGIILTKNSKIIVGAIAFECSPLRWAYVGKTFNPDSILNRKQTQNRNC